LNHAQVIDERAPPLRELAFATSAGFDEHVLDLGGIAA
jgi:hypothetical protein